MDPVERQQFARRAYLYLAARLEGAKRHIFIHRGFWPSDQELGMIMEIQLERAIQREFVDPQADREELEEWIVITREVVAIIAKELG